MKQKHGLHLSAFVDRDAYRAALGLIAIVLAVPVMAQETHHHRDGSPAGPSPPVFVASTARPFAALMDDAMAVMDDSMRRAPVNGIAEHDFVTMMIPHHQGAIDMAKALLLNTKDPELINLAQGIITEQQNEIRVMQAWLRRYNAAHSSGAPVRPK